MGKALTSASNPGEPGDPWANTGGDQRENSESLQRGRVKGGGGTQKPARPTEPNSCRMRKQPEPAVPSDGAAGGRCAEPTLRTRLAWECLTPHRISGHPLAPQPKVPGSGHGSISAFQPASHQCRAAGTEPCLAWRGGCPPTPLEGLPQPPGALSPPSPMIYSQDVS